MAKLTNEISPAVPPLPTVPVLLTAARQLPRRQGQEGERGRDDTVLVATVSSLATME